MRPTRMSPSSPIQRRWLRDADVVLAVQPPALDVVDAMKEGAILISFIYAEQEQALVQRLLEKKITCFAMERIPRISRAQAMDALSSQSAWRATTAVQLGATHLTRMLPEDHHGRRRHRSREGAGDGPRCRGPRGARHRPSSGRRRRRLRRPPGNRTSRRYRSARNSSRPAWMRAARAAMPAS